MNWTQVTCRRQDLGQMYEDKPPSSKTFRGNWPLLVSIEENQGTLRLFSLKPGYFGRLRHELDSPNLRCHLPHYHNPFRNLPLSRTEMGCGGKDNCNSYLTYLLSDLRNSLPSKEANRLSPAFVVVKETFLDRPDRSLGMRGLTS
ncbi:hypothetical protein AVEN_175580-1 [Araneus ventricosus]|uniref:Uncharacterized protein n=1 Tax=Araneus ventricosus TaxID=182803 RepID=A0A4Y2I5H0_ARAVE|nr:hypothetical protein AVEN_175580-1 [Araneus ventricosus]